MDTKINIYYRKNHFPQFFSISKPLCLRTELLSSLRHAIELPQKNSYWRQKNWQGSPFFFRHLSKSTPANLYKFEEEVEFKKIYLEYIGKDIKLFLSFITILLKKFQFSTAGPIGILDLESGFFISKWFFTLHLQKKISFVGMYLVYHLVYVILHCFFQFLGNVSCKIPRITWWYVKNQTKRKNQN